MAIMSVGHRLTILKGVYDIKVKQEIPIELDDYMPPCKFDRGGRPLPMLIAPSGQC